MKSYFDPRDHPIDPTEKLNDNDSDLLWENEIPEDSFIDSTNTSGGVNYPTPGEDPRPSTPPQLLESGNGDTDDPIHAVEKLLRMRRSKETIG